MLKSNLFFLCNVFKLSKQTRNLSETKLVSGVLNLRKSIENSGNLKRSKLTKRKILQNSFPKWLKPEQLKSVQQISSFTYTHQEVSCITMTKKFEITHIDSVILDIPPTRDCMFYWDKINPMLERLHNVDLHLLEQNVFPPKFDRINLHLKSITMLLIGSLQQRNPSVVQLDRFKVGDHFGLVVEGTRSRINSENLITEILKDHSWKDNEIKYPTQKLSTSYNKSYLHQYDPATGEDLSLPLSLPLSDAILQAIAFWDIVKKLNV